MERVTHGDVGDEMAGGGWGECGGGVVGRSSPVHDICEDGELGNVRDDEEVPMWSHSAPSLIIRSHSAVSFPKSDASTDGDTIARGMITRLTNHITLHSITLLTNLISSLLWLAS